MSTVDTTHTHSHSEDSDGHGLNATVVYGPVVSRRYGTSLGINILPAAVKQCSFNCVYCQLGWNDPALAFDPTAFPSVEKVEEDFRSALLELKNSATPQLDDIVISGNGEPTLHPDFARVIAALQKVKNELQPTVPLICLTSGTRLHEASICQALQSLDECAIKLDANMGRVNLPPPGFDRERLLNIISKMPNAVIQSCFVAGSVNNTDPASITDWLRAVKIARPKRLDLYTVSRATAAKGLAPVTTEFLEQLAETVATQLASPVRVIA